ncbi:MAG: anti-sigma factor antagonist [Parachlamydia sp.]|jgi:anti-anti-sigma factor|nr:anti-sigma factor antagonist [Parachlamydia sp.]
MRDTLNSPDFISYLQEKVLKNRISLRTDIFSSASMAFQKEKSHQYICEVYQPAEDLLDIFIVHIPADLPSSLIIASSIKFALRRLALPAVKGYQFTKDMVWDKNLLETHEILLNLKKEVINTLSDCNINISIFYGRFNLYYQIFNYINFGIGNSLFIDKNKKAINLKKKESISEDNALDGHFVSFKEGNWLLFYEGEEETLQFGHKDFSSDAQHLITQYKNSFAKPDFIFAIKIDEKFAKMRPIKGKTAKFFGDFAQLVPVRFFVSEICSQVPCQTKNFSHKMQLAIDELFCNIITHAYKDEKTKGAIVIEGLISDDGVYFILSDQGTPFDPTLIPFPNFAGEIEGGFGFFIVQQIADHITYIPKKDESDWNRIRIFKRYYTNEDPMELSTYLVDNKLVIMPKEENLDAKNATNFKKNVLNLLQSGQTVQVILDLTYLRFIDSSGLGVLLSLQRILNKQGGILKLVHLNKPVQSMFEIVSMHRIFEIFQNVDDAVQSFT